MVFSMAWVKKCNCIPIIDGSSLHYNKNELIKNLNGTHENEISLFGNGDFFHIDELPKGRNAH